MEYRMFGESGCSVSRMGLGLAALGRYLDGELAGKIWGVSMIHLKWKLKPM